MKTHHANTYDLILASQSEDKMGSLLEMATYGLCMLSVVAAIISATTPPVAAHPVGQTNYQLEQRM
jgi:hypothetical protein